jgi:hypothetical protein
MITAATSLFFESFVRILFQLGVYRYSLGVAYFWSAAGKSPLRIVRWVSFIVASFPTIIIITDGYRKGKSWMVWSGGVLFAFYLFLVWLDVYTGYLEVWCDRWWPPKTDDEESLYLSQFLSRA